MTRPHVHVFPVDDSFLAAESDDSEGFSRAILEAWKELTNFGRRITYTGGEHWAELTCDGEECWLIQESPDVTVREILPSG